MEKIKNWFVGIFDKLKKIWKDFEDKNPKLSQWVREGGLFVLVSNFVTIIRGFLYGWLEPLYSFLGDASWGWPNANFELFGQPINFMIVGFDQKDGGLAYTASFWTASFLCEALNFLMQRKFTFRSKGNIAFQGSIYVVAWAFIMVIINSIVSILKGLLGGFQVPDEIIGLITTFIQGGVSMVIMFFVNKIIFTDAPKAEQLLEEKTEA